MANQTTDNSALWQSICPMCMTIYLHTEGEPCPRCEAKRMEEANRVLGRTLQHQVELGKQEHEARLAAEHEAASLSTRVGELRKQLAGHKQARDNWRFAAQNHQHDVQKLREAVQTALTTLRTMEQWGKEQIAAARDPTGAVFFGQTLLGKIGPLLQAVLDIPVHVYNGPPAAEPVETSGNPLCPNCMHSATCHTVDLDRGHDYDFAHCEMFERRVAPSDRDVEWRADAERTIGRGFTNDMPDCAGDLLLYAQRVLVLLTEAATRCEAKD